MNLKYVLCKWFQLIVFSFVHLQMSEFTDVERVTRGAPKVMHMKQKTALKQELIGMTVLPSHGLPVVSSSLPSCSASCFNKSEQLKVKPDTSGTEADRCICVDTWIAINMDFLCSIEYYFIHNSIILTLLKCINTSKGESSF